MSDLLIAVIGGSVGVLLPAIVRGLTIPTDARLHDAAIQGRDEQLGTWVADRHVLLSQHCKAVRDALPAPGVPTEAPDTETTPQEKMDNWQHGDYLKAAGPADVQIAALRAAALHEYRDEERRANIARGEILATEGWAHRCWRASPWGPTAPNLQTPEQAKVVLDLWRKPSRMTSGPGIYPDDATQRTLDGVLNAPRLIEP